MVLVKVVVEFCEIVVEEGYVCLWNVLIIEDNDEVFVFV